MQKIKYIIYFVRYEFFLMYNLLFNWNNILFMKDYYFEAHNGLIGPLKRLTRWEGKLGDMLFFLDI